MTQSNFENRILASLPESELNRLRPHLVPVDLPQRKVLLDGPPTHGYFLEKGMASVVVDLDNGASVEVGVIGQEGFVGFPIVLGTRAVPGCTFVQVAGHGFQIAAKKLKEEYETPGVLRFAIHRYIQGFIVLASQTAACNGVHNYTERLARWLLTCHDRVDADAIRLADDFLARMIAAPMPHVCAAADLLHRAGFIDYTNGVVTILDRDGLENSSCSCYRVVRKEFQNLQLL
jgi:CRP-like cAMP-binding protein